jgi:hypothetical protein
MTRKTLEVAFIAVRLEVEVEARPEGVVNRSLPDPDFTRTSRRAVSPACFGQAPVAQALGPSPGGDSGSILQTNTGTGAPVFAPAGNHRWRNPAATVAMQETRPTPIQLKLP